MNYDQSRTGVVWWDVIGVLQAAKDGKAIQIASCDYRVKPEPRVFYAVLREHTGQCVAYRDRELAEKLADPPNYKVVKLVEVPDDSM